MTDLEIISVAKLCIDFGMTVLIWLVQLVIYPSFLFFSKADLTKWHAVYTRSVTIVVMPLMLSQLFISIVAAYRQYDIGSATHLILVTAMWLITFTKAIPLHGSLEPAAEPHPIAQQLIKVNWYRSIGWTLIFLISFFQLLSS